MLKVQATKPQPTGRVSRPCLLMRCVVCAAWLMRWATSQNEKNYLAQRTTTENKRKKVNENSNRVFVSKQSSREG
jgi:hypothetical protein